MALPEAAAAPAGVRRSQTYFPEIESLRGVAIALVVLFHTSGIVVPKMDTRGMLVSPVEAFVHAGHTGVSLFFVLSGFLLSMPFLVEAAGGRQVSRRQYFVRRALRILPAYWTAVLVGSLIVTVRVAPAFGRAPVMQANPWVQAVGVFPFLFCLASAPYLFFLNAFSTHVANLDPYNVGWWSLATEVQFYLVLPFLPLFLRSRVGRWAGVAVLAVWAGLYAWELFGPLPFLSVGKHILLRLSLFGRGSFFAFGICAAWVHQRHGEAIRARLAASPSVRRGGADVALLAVLVGLGMLLRYAIYRGQISAEGGALFMWHLPEGALWTAVVLLVLLAPLRTRAVLSNRVLHALGVISYSLYLVHVPVLRNGMKYLYGLPTGIGAGWSPAVVGLMGLLLAACLGLATLTYLGIERPFLVRKARLDR